MTNNKTVEDCIEPKLGTEVKHIKTDRPVLSEGALTQYHSKPCCYGESEDENLNVNVSYKVRSGLSRGSYFFDAHCLHSSAIKVTTIIVNKNLPTLQDPLHQLNGGNGLTQLKMNLTCFSRKEHRKTVR